MLIICIKTYILFERIEKLSYIHIYIFLQSNINESVYDYII